MLPLSVIHRVPYPSLLSFCMALFPSLQLKPASLFPFPLHSTYV